MDSRTFLDRAAKAKPQPVYVLHGEEQFLKRQVIAALCKIVLGPGDDNFDLTTFNGENLTFAALRNELATLPFLSPRRLVVVENADRGRSASRVTDQLAPAEDTDSEETDLPVGSFVTKERKRLEAYV